MPQPRKSSGRSSSSRSGSSSRRASSARSSGASTAKRSASSRKAAASKGGKTTARKRSAAKASGSAAKTAARGARSAGVEAKTVAELREALRKNLIRPMEIVMLSRERIEEVLGEAVDQGRVTARDAQRISAGLVKRGQKQTSDVLKDLENLLERGRDEVEGRASKARSRASGARGRAAKRASGARSRAVRTASPALAQADRVRRAAGVGANFPITGYEDLTATQIQSRLSTLTPAELRKVRDHERRGGKRKTVLNAIESKLR
jgi:polyhydroxyalkanoate synthesis regulator phasin